MTVPLICLAHEDHLSYPPNGKVFFLPRHIESFCRKMLFNSCIFLKRLARHGNTHVEPKKNVETLANLVFINQSSTSFGQRNTSLTMAFDYRSVSGFFGGRNDSI